VIEGKQLGRQIGCPTANVETFDIHKLVPGDGVYAVFVQTGGKIYKGMLNIGIRPTVNFNADHKSIEVHIFNFDADIYNSGITLYFVDKIRDEQKFAGIAELKEQLAKDRIFALSILSNADLEQI
jgi:riboflavin kinase/FMN adenylyltransferase